MQRLQIVSLISILFILLSCKKDRLVNNKEIFVGTWNWNHTRVENFNYSAQLSTYDTILSAEIPNKYSVEFLKKGKLFFLHYDMVVGRFRTVFASYEYVGDVVDQTHEIHDARRFVIYLDNMTDADHELHGWINSDTLILFGKHPYSNIGYDEGPVHEQDQTLYRNFFVKE